MQIAQTPSAWSYWQTLSTCIKNLPTNLVAGRTWIAESTAATAQNIIRIPQKSKIGGHSQQATIQPRLPKKGFQISVACSTHSMWTMKTPSGHHQVMASAVWLAQETHLYQHLLAMIPNPWRNSQSFEAYAPRSKSSHPFSQHQTIPDEQRCSPQLNGTALNTKKDSTWA